MYNTIPQKSEAKNYKRRFFSCCHSQTKYQIKYTTQ